MRLAFPVLVFFVAYAAMAEKVEQIPANAVNPYYGPNIPVVGQRNIPTATTTTTSTLTSVVTCTVSLNGLQPCTGRRRRGIQLDEDPDEQFISPSVVQGVETTDQVPIRESRSADPQYFIASPHAYYPQEIQSGYYSPLQYHPVGLPIRYYGSYPMVDNRLFWTDVFPGLFPTTTITSTVFTVSTFSSIPSCAAGGFLQCPK